MTDTMAGEADLDLYDDKFQAGIAWTMRQWGEALGLTTWTQGDGSESVEGDVGAEIHGILVDAGLRDPETNEMATLAAQPSAGAQGEVSAAIRAKYDTVKATTYNPGTPAERNKEGRLQGLNDAIAIAMVHEDRATPAQPDTGDLAALREALEKIGHYVEEPGSPPPEDEMRSIALAALSKPNAQGREGGMKKSGWCWIANSPKWHWFEADGRSLCGKWLTFGSERHQGNDDSKDNCAACRRKVVARNTTTPEDVGA